MSGLEVFAVLSIIGAVAGVASAGLQLVGAIWGRKRPAARPVKLSITAGADTPQSILLGKVASAGTLIYANFWGQSGKTPNAFLTYVVLLSDSAVTSLDAVYVNGVKLTKTSGHQLVAGLGDPFEHAEFGGTGHPHVWVKFYDGTQTTADSFLQNTVSSLDRPWEITAVVKGKAYAAITFLRQDEIFKGYPKAFFEVTGLPLTYPQGAAPAGSNTNPAVAAYNILRGITLPDGSKYGGQTISPWQLPADKWAAEAVYCAGTETVGGKARRRFEFGLEVFLNVHPVETLEQILAAYSADLIESSGRFYTRSSLPSTAEFTISDDDVIATKPQSAGLQPSVAVGVTRATATFSNSDQAWARDSIKPIINAERETELGRELPLDLNLNAVPYEWQAQHVARIELQTMQRTFTHTFVLPSKFWTLEPGMAGTVSSGSSRWGYTNKWFVIKRVVDRADGLIEVTLLETDPTDKSWNPSTDYEAPDYRTTRPGDAVPPVPSFTPTSWTLAAAGELRQGETNIYDRVYAVFGFGDDIGPAEFIECELRNSGTTVSDANIVWQGTTAYDLGGAITAELRGRTTYYGRVRRLGDGTVSEQWSGFQSITTGQLFAATGVTRFDQLTGHVLQSMLSDALRAKIAIWDANRALIVQNQSLIGAGQSSLSLTYRFYRTNVAQVGSDGSFNFAGATTYAQTLTAGMLTLSNADGGSNLNTNRLRGLAAGALITVKWPALAAPMVWEVTGAATKVNTDRAVQVPVRAITNMVPLSEGSTASTIPTTDTAVGVSIGVALAAGEALAGLYQRLLTSDFNTYTAATQLVLAKLEGITVSYSMYVSSSGAVDAANEWNLSKGTVSAATYGAAYAADTLTLYSSADNLAALSALTEEDSVAIFFPGLVQPLQYDVTATATATGQIVSIPVSVVNTAIPALASGYMSQNIPTTTLPTVMRIGRVGGAVGAAVREMYKVGILDSGDIIAMWTAQAQINEDLVARTAGIGLLAQTGRPTEVFMYAERIVMITPARGTNNPFPIFLAQAQDGEYPAAIFLNALVHIKDANIEGTISARHISADVRNVNVVFNSQRGKTIGTDPVDVSLIPGTWPERPFRVVFDFAFKGDFEDSQTLDHSDSVTTMPSIWSGGRTAAMPFEYFAYANSTQVKGGRLYAKPFFDVAGNVEGFRLWISVPNPTGRDTVADKNIALVTISVESHPDVTPGDLRTDFTGDPLEFGLSSYELRVELNVALPANRRSQGTIINSLPLADGGEDSKTYSIVGTLPTGLTLAGATDKPYLTGTPTVTQETTVTLSCTDGKATVTSMLKVIVGNPASIVAAGPTFTTREIPNQFAPNNVLTTLSPLPLATGGTPPLQYFLVPDGTPVPTWANALFIRNVWRLEMAPGSYGTLAAVPEGSVFNLAWEVRDSNSQVVRRDRIPFSITIGTNELRFSVSSTGFVFQSGRALETTRTSTQWRNDLPLAVGGSSDRQYSLTGAVPSWISIADAQGEPYLVGTPPAVTSRTYLPFTLQCVSGDDTATTAIDLYVLPAAPALTFFGLSIPDRLNEPGAITVNFLPHAIGGVTPVSYTLRAVNPTTGVPLQSGFPTVVVTLVGAIYQATITPGAGSDREWTMRWTATDSSPTPQTDYIDFQYSVKGFRFPDLSFTRVYPANRNVQVPITDQKWLLPSLIDAAKDLVRNTAPARLTYTLTGELPEGLMFNQGNANPNPGSSLEGHPYTPFLTGTPTKEETKTVILAANFRDAYTASITGIIRTFSQLKFAALQADISVAAATAGTSYTTPGLPGIVLNGNTLTGKDAEVYSASVDFTPRRDDIGRYVTTTFNRSTTAAAHTVTIACKGLWLNDAVNFRPEDSLRITYKCVADGVTVESYFDVTFT